jgi:molybdate transport system regulatory protein
MGKKVQNIFKKGVYNVKGSLWMEKDGQRFFGPEPVELLEHIEQSGSISKAAKEMGLSYKKAWELVSNMNKTTEHSIVLTSIGGEYGGGSIISEEARQMIVYYRGLHERFLLFLEKESADLK